MMMMIEGRADHTRLQLRTTNGAFMYAQYDEDCSCYMISTDKEMEECYWFNVADIEEAIEFLNILKNKLEGVADGNA